METSHTFDASCYCGVGISEEKRAMTPLLYKGKHMLSMYL
uniref:Uncharacterized protein n=1 Tax=Rhizophora mucronata TaxID=61149 RepID=A0A2P2NL64_RHIMU